MADSDPVVFDRQSADRISKVVRQVEGQRRDMRPTRRNEPPRLSDKLYARISNDNPNAADHFYSWKRVVLKFDQDTYTFSWDEWDKGEEDATDYDGIYAIEFTGNYCVPNNIIRELILLDYTDAGEPVYGFDCPVTSTLQKGTLTDDFNPGTYGGILFIPISPIPEGQTSNGLITGSANAGVRVTDGGSSEMFYQYPNKEGDEIYYWGTTEDVNGNINIGFLASPSIRWLPDFTSGDEGKILRTDENGKMYWGDPPPPFNP